MDIRKISVMSGGLLFAGAVFAATVTDPAWTAGEDVVIAAGDTVVLDRVYSLRGILRIEGWTH